MTTLRALMTTILTGFVAIHWGPAHALTTREAANRAVVLAFYEAAINRKDAEDAVTYLGPRYVQHNPRAQDGADGLKAFVGGYLKTANPQLKAVVQRVVVEGDLVVLHVRSEPAPGAPVSAIVDIFRLEDGKIVEHWDVMQPVPERTVSGNGMF